MGVNVEHFSVVTVSTVCISTATFVTFFTNSVSIFIFFFKSICCLLHVTIFVNRDSVGKYTKGTLFQVCHLGVLAYIWPSCLHKDVVLHEGMLHLRIMHEKKSKGKWRQFFNSSMSSVFRWGGGTEVTIR